MNKKRRAQSPLFAFFKMLISPIMGWKNIKSVAYKPEEVASRLYYPLIALIAAGEFLQLIYNPDLTVTVLLKDALITFISFFLGYFSILFLIELLFKKDARIKLTTDFGKNFILMNLSSMVLFYFLYEVLPLAGPILVFTPIYTLYLIIKGVKCLRLPQENYNLNIFLLSLLIIGMPIIIYKIFQAIMPIA